jgi:hypothetical protein
MSTMYNFHFSGSFCVPPRHSQAFSAKEVHGLYWSLSISKIDCKYCSCLWTKGRHSQSQTGLLSLLSWSAFLCSSSHPSSCCHLSSPPSPALFAARAWNSVMPQCQASLQRCKPEKGVYIARGTLMYCDWLDTPLSRDLHMQHDTRCFMYV